VLELRRRQATEYLQRLAGGLSSRGVAVETRVVRGDPSRRIPAVAKHDRADLVVLATHGRAGTEAFWSGSVGAKVLRRVRTSVLLVPAPPPGETAPPDSKSP
jgi:nucleotide-binding universal stress UspA family protein